MWQDVSYAYFADVSNPENIELLGILLGKDQYVVDIDSGVTTFMVTSGVQAQMIKLDAKAGKRYYALARPVYAAGFRFRPIRSDSSSDYSMITEDFSNWKNVTVKTMNDKSDIAVGYYNNFIAQMYADAMEDWAEKNEVEREELTFRQEDGVSF